MKKNLNSIEIAQKLRDSANRCTRLNAEVAMLCEHALAAAECLDKEGKHMEIIVDLLRQIESCDGTSQINTDKANSFLRNDIQNVEFDNHPALGKSLLRRLLTVQPS